MKVFWTIVLLLLPCARAGAARPWKACAQGDFDCYIKTTGEEIARNPKDAEAYLVRGTMLSNANKGREDDGLKDLNRALSLNPSSADAWYWRGSNYWDRKDYTRAISDYTKAIALDPKRVDARNMRCDSFKKLKKYALALRDCRRAVELEPKTFGNHISLSEIYELMGDEKSAAAERTLAETLKPKD
ncbi:MAG: tetratricopeptide repeat protein [Elusimicrobiota bacterium]